MVAEWRSTAWKVGTSRSRTVAADRSESVIVPLPWPEATPWPSLPGHDQVAQQQPG